MQGIDHSTRRTFLAAMSAVVLSSTLCGCSRSISKLNLVYASFRKEDLLLAYKQFVITLFPSLNNVSDLEFEESYMSQSFGTLSLIAEFKSRCLELLDNVKSVQISELPREIQEKQVLLLYSKDKSHFNDGVDKILIQFNSLIFKKYMKLPS